jgi:putative tricarboxylic transport membrane protein
MRKKSKTRSDRAGFVLRISGPRDFYGGLALILLALVGFWLMRDLPGQQGFVFGAGTAPRLSATLLAIVGGLIALNGLLFDGPPIEPFALRGPAFVLAGIFAFAVMIQGISLDGFGIPLRLPPLGLVASTFSAFTISILGTTEMRWLESLAAAVAMTAFCIGLFVYLLQLPFQLWPWS